MNRAQYPNKAPQPMPGNIRSALAKRKLTDAYEARPQYQQTDYLKWIATAAGPAAKQKRLDQMLDELENGGLFKGEPWTPPAKPEQAEKAVQAEQAEKPKAAPAKAEKPKAAPAKAEKPAAAKPKTAKA